MGKRQKETPNEWLPTATPLMIWFAAWAGDSDYYGTLYRLANGQGRLLYRWRRYDPTSHDPFDGKDEQRWYTVKAPRSAADPVEALRATTRALLADLREGKLALPPPGIFEEVEVVDGDVEAALRGKAWAHFREVGEA